MVSRTHYSTDTVIHIGEHAIGGGNFFLVAGPCSVESEEQICSIAMQVKAAGAHALRGGTFKARTSPRSFQGLGKEGIAYLRAAKAATGLPLVSEITGVAQLPFFEDIDIIQVGARNMQNTVLLKELGRLHKPVLLKRGLANTYEELLMSVEYLTDEGNEQIILCERGIRTFETGTRNTLDVSAVPVLHELSCFPVIVDPSHAAGRAALVESLSYAAVAAGADGLMIEVHDDPAHALSDGQQAITPETFARIQATATRLRAAFETE